MNLDILDKNNPLDIPSEYLYKGPRTYLCAFDDFAIETEYEVYGYDYETWIWVRTNPDLHLCAYNFCAIRTHSLISALNKLSHDRITGLELMGKLNLLGQIAGKGWIQHYE